jgi:hypothetical protein
MKERYIIGSIMTTAGAVPLISTALSFLDHLGTIMVRWSINRDHYAVAPGIYAVGTPGESSDVFVTANYKLSFDQVRKNLNGLNAWLLVLDTKGVNVWCASGKGVFGTNELVNRIRLSSLDKIINHHRLILPQLSATGVSAYKVKELTRYLPPVLVKSESSNANLNVDFSLNNLKLKPNPGYTVIFGPVRADDIKAFISDGYKAAREMRKVQFRLTDRAKLIPVDFINGKFYLLAALAIIFVLSGLGSWGISLQEAMDHSFQAMVNVLLAYSAGIVFTPIFLPYLPGHSFAFKGFVSGLILSVILLLTGMIRNNIPEMISWVLIISAISSFLAMNFTGSSTFTSLSGVKKEMKVAIPLQITFSALGLALFVICNFI